jgi:branched-chain amino acid transport system ATP-binding protein
MTASGVAGASFSARDIRVDFGGLVACDLDELDVSGGQLLAVIGPNGAGKTTLLNALVGLVPVTGNSSVELRHSDGELIQLAGRRTEAITRAGVARTFQGLGLIQDLTAFENLLLARFTRQRSGVFASMLRTPRMLAEERRESQYVDQLLHEADLVGVRDAQARHLPYGIQKRLDLLRALALEPSVLLLDEPMAGLTHGEKAVMRDEIERTVKARQLPLLMVEHDMNIVMGMADAVLVMVNGTRLMTDVPAIVSRDPRVIEAYLGPDSIDHDGGSRR